MDLCWKNSTWMTPVAIFAHMYTHLMFFGKVSSGLTPFVFAPITMDSSWHWGQLIFLFEHIFVYLIWKESIICFLSTTCYFLPLPDLWCLSLQSFPYLLSQMLYLSLSLFIYVSILGIIFISLLCKLSSRLLSSKTLLKRKISRLISMHYPASYGNKN